MQVSAVSHAALAAAVTRPVVSGVYSGNAAGAVAAFKANPALTGISVSDTAAAVASNFGELAKMGKALTSITATGGAAALTLSATQKIDTNTKAALATIVGNYTVTVTGVTADSIKATLADTHVNHLKIADTAANVSAAFVGKTPDVIASASKIDKIVLSDPGTAVSVTGAQYTANQALFGKIEGKTGATTSSASIVKFSLTSVSHGAYSTLGANLASALSATKVVAVTVLDTAANLNGLSADQINSSKVTTIGQSDTARVELSAAKFKAINDKGNLDKFAPGVKVVVTDIKATDAVSVLAALDAAGLDGTVTVKDTAANVLLKAGVNNASGVGSKIKTTIEDSVFNVKANWGGIKTQNGLELAKIKLTDTGSVAGKLEVAFGDVDAQKALFDKMFAGSGLGTKAVGILSVTGVAAADVLATAKLASVGNIKVDDTLNAGITGQAMLKSNTKVTDIKLTGAAADIQTNLDKLDAFGKKLSGVVASDAASITVSYDKYVKQSGLIDKIDVATHSASFVVTDVTADKAKLVLNNKNDDGTFTRNTDVATITIKDSAAKITSNWTALQAAFTASDLTDAKLTDNGVIKLASTATYNTAAAASGFLDKIRTTNAGLATKDQKSYSIAVSGVAVADLSGNSSIQSTSTANWATVSKVSLSDTTDNISSQLAGDIEALGSKLDKIVQTDAPSGRHDIQVSWADLQRSPIAAELGKIYGNVADNTTLGYHLDTDQTTFNNHYGLKVTGVTAEDVKYLVDDDRFHAKVNKLTVSDTAANISANLAGLQHANSLAKMDANSIENSDSGLIEIQASDFKANTYKDLLAKADVQELRVLDAKASDVNGIVAKGHVAELTVTDSSTSVSAKLADLDALAVDTAHTLTKITLDNPNVALTLSATQYNNDGSAALDLLKNNIDADHPDGNYTVVVNSVDLADAANAQKMVNADAHVTSYSASGVGADIVTNLTNLELNATKLGSISQTDTTQLAISGDDYHDSIGTLNKINNGSGGYDAKVTDLQADDTVAAEADGNVTEFTVKGDAAHLGANWDSLQASAVSVANAGGPKMTGITLDGTDTIDTTYTQWHDSTELKTAMSDTSFKWNVSGVDTAKVADVFADDQLDHMTVTGSATAIVAALGDGTTPGDIDTALAKITSITVSDNAVLALTGTQYADNTDGSTKVLDLTTNADGGHYHATVAGLVGNKVADATADQNVDSFTVADLGASLSGTKFTDLVAANTAGKLTSVTIDQADDTVTVAMADMVANHEDYANTLNKFDTTNPVKLALTV